VLSTHRALFMNESVSECFRTHVCSKRKEEELWHVLSCSSLSLSLSFSFFSLLFLSLARVEAWLLMMSSALSCFKHLSLSAAAKIIIQNELHACKKHLTVNYTQPCCTENSHTEVLYSSRVNIFCLPPWRMVVRTHDTHEGI
jgi:hypothetical protein